MVREKLEEIIADVERVLETDPAARQTLRGVLRNATEALASLPEWVSVKERLPEWGSKEQVLVALTDRHTKELCVSDGWWRKTNWEDYWPHDAIVTHWMSAPTHPEKP